MNGKKLRLNEYKLTYGQETTYINMYGAFKNKKNGNKYAIYSYENKNKLNYGTFFQRNKEAVIMTAKEEPKEMIKELVDYLLEGTCHPQYEIISLEEIETIQIIDEHISMLNVDLNKLKELTIPKPVTQEIKEETKKKKQIFIAPIFFAIFILVVVAFFFVNPEVIIGKDRYYLCTKSSFHKSLPATVTDEITLTFNGRGNITNIDLITDYKFNDTNYYQEFKDKGYFYQHMEEGDTYKFIDNQYTYRLFSNKEYGEDYFLPSEESELISYYQDKNYTCKRVEIDE